MAAANRSKQSKRATWFRPSATLAAAIDRLVAYYGNDLGEAHLPFNFSLLETRWHARDIAKLVDDYEAALPECGWPNWVLGNHDRPRIATRVGSAQAGIAAMLLLTLRGTPTIYYGDEIGLPQVPIPPDRIRDPFEKNVPSIGVGRDGARTPMQWDCSPFAGFSSSEPWLPLTADWTMRNVDMLRRDKNSIYMIYQRLIEARRHSQALQRGSYRPIASKGDLLLYVREFGSERILTALNLGTTPAIVETSFGDFKGKVIVSTSGLHDGDHIDAIIRLDAMRAWSSHLRRMLLFLQTQNEKKNQWMQAPMNAVARHLAREAFGEPGADWNEKFASLLRLM